MSKSFNCNYCATPIVINGKVVGECEHYPRPKTAFERAYARTVKTMTIAKRLAEQPDDISSVYRRIKGMTMRKVP